ncbi:hypothetical protein Tco_1452212, partial [Tanacetum coccineum]
TNSYEFHLANKKCLVDVEVFWKILDICPRVQGVDFTEVPDDETTLSYLINLGYKGPLHKNPSIYVDHMHQPWITLAAIINKCLSGKTASNDRLRKLRIDILWGMFYKENVNYSKLIWEDFAFQIDHRMENQRRRCRRVIMKKVSISVDDNIIPELDFTLELGKSMSLTEAVEEEAARDTSSVLKKTSPDPSQKLNGVHTLTPEEQLTVDTIQPLKASIKSIRSQPHAGGSSEGTGTKPGVLDESTITPTTSSEGTGTKLGVPNEEKFTSEAKADVTLDWGSKEESEYTKEDDDDDENIEWVDTDEEEEKNDDDDENIEWVDTDEEEEKNDDDDEEYVKDDDEETDDEFVHGDEQVNDDEDEEMTTAEDADTGNDDKEITYTTKADAEKTEEVKDDIKKVELPLSSSNLSISSGFGN